MIDVINMTNIFVRSFYMEEMIFEIDGISYYHNFNTKETREFDWDELQGIIPMPYNRIFKDYKNILAYRQSLNDLFEGKINSVRLNEFCTKEED